MCKRIAGVKRMSNVCNGGSQEHCSLVERLVDEWRATGKAWSFHGNRSISLQVPLRVDGVIVPSGTRVEFFVDPKKPADPNGIRKLATIAHGPDGPISVRVDGQTVFPSRSGR